MANEFSTNTTLQAPIIDESSIRFCGAQQIRALDAHSEIMELAGELKIASIEIARLREKLVLIEGERTLNM